MGTGIANATQVGWGSQTPTLQATARGTARRGPSRKRRSGGKKKRARAAAPRRRVKRSRSRKARLVKGSAAAKRYMAKIRRMRKK
jgi:hypothetical protein